MSPVRYPSLAHRKQTFRRAEADLNRAVAASAPAPVAPRAVTYAEPLAPTLPGMVHGIVGRDPWQIQCDGCGAIEHLEVLALMRTRFMLGSDPRRLCPDCAGDL